VSADSSMTDTRDMYSVHEAFRRALRDAPGQIASMDDNDTEWSSRFARYLSEVLWLLDIHQQGEDDLMYPVLVERAPESRDLLARMDSQHVAVKSMFESANTAALAFASSGTVADGQALTDACASLLAILDPHLGEEEVEVLPLVARTLTPEEWKRLPQHALSQYAGDRIWLPFGLAFEAMPDDLRQEMFAELPPPVLDMWLGGGSDAYDAEMATIRREGS
jgi:hemerythrin-like domain-containing protein